MQDNLKLYKILQVIYDINNNRNINVSRGFQMYNENFLPKVNEYFSLNVNGKHVVTQVVDVKDNIVVVTKC